jgi:hypothetical protein
MCQSKIEAGQAKVEVPEQPFLNRRQFLQIAGLIGLAKLSSWLQGCLNLSADPNLMGHADATQPGHPPETPVASADPAGQLELKQPVKPTKAEPQPAESQEPELSEANPEPPAPETEPDLEAAYDQLFTQGIKSAHGLPVWTQEQFLDLIDSKASREGELIRAEFTRQLAEALAPLEQGIPSDFRLVLPDWVSRRSFIQALADILGQRSTASVINYQDKATSASRNMLLLAPYVTGEGESAIGWQLSSLSDHQSQLVLPIATEEGFQFQELPLISRHAGPEAMALLPGYPPLFVRLHPTDQNFVLAIYDDSAGRSEARWRFNPSLSQVQIEKLHPEIWPNWYRQEWDQAAAGDWLHIDNIQSTRQPEFSIAHSIHHSFGKFKLASVEAGPATDFVLAALYHNEIRARNFRGTREEYFAELKLGRLPHLCQKTVWDMGTRKQITLDRAPIRRVHYVLTHEHLGDLPEGIRLNYSVGPGGAGLYDLIYDAGEAILYTQVTDIPESNEAAKSRQAVGRILSPTTYIMYTDDDMRNNARMSPSGISIGIHGSGGQQIFDYWVEMSTKYFNRKTELGGYPIKITPVR